MDVQVYYLPELSPLLDPITENSPSGEDVRYDERFLRLKAEVENSDTHYARVKQLSIELLKHQTKDLRIAGYLLMACAHEDGMMGFVTALHVYAHLIQTYWTSLYPRRVVLRQAAIDWLKQVPLTQVLRTLEIGKSGQAEYEALKRAVEHLRRVLGDPVGLCAEDLVFLDAWLSYGKQAYQRWLKTRKHEFSWESIFSAESLSKQNQNNNLNQDVLIAHLKKIPTKLSERERFLKFYEAAEACLKHRRSDLALPILDHLEHCIEKYQLADWEPSLALMVWTLQLKIQKNAKTNSQNLKQKIASLSLLELV